MSQSRRAFLGTAVAGSASIIPLLQARGMEAGNGISPRFDANGVIRLNSNENPHGPARAAVEAITGAFGDANRYTQSNDAALRAAVARRHGVKDENVLLGAGSGETLRICTEALTSNTAHLVAAAPTFEQPAAHMTRLGRETRAPNVDALLRLDLGAMAAAAPGAGLVFLCNPNNPTGTAYPLSDVLAFIKDVHRRAPDAFVLVDEAYFEYCDLPGYDTAIPAALDDPRIIVARTFSKVFGLAGMRVGYGIAHASTIKRLEPWRLQNSVSALSSAAAMASCELTGHIKEQQRMNGEARALALKTLNDAGFKALPTYTNFIMADIRRDAKAFQDACAKEGVAIGRPFPPLNTHARISIGTMDEMRRALPVITGLLKA
ncbi:MAG: aminotransferase class I/II-fold pyridoxal phosphate-dependent enzyme [Gemmatimonadetes bacterium]|nr:aminotransferase class I/II-fold pyridoxal phosphate-dependent enzyme [Gemmatimonadota bacterium]